MPLSTPASVAQQIETLFDGGSVAGLTDRQLIDRFSSRRDETSEVAFSLASIDPVNYAADPVSDGDGRIVLRALIPGTSYLFVDRSTLGAPPCLQLRKEFTVRSAQTLEVGDILIQKPEKAK